MDSTCRYVFVAGIHPPWREYQVLLSLCDGMHVCTDYTLLWKSFEGTELEPMLIPWEKSPPKEKFSSEGDGTHDAASSRTASPTHYQQAIPAQLEHQLWSHWYDMNRQPYLDLPQVRWMLYQWATNAQNTTHLNSTNFEVIGMTWPGSHTWISRRWGRCCTTVQPAETEHYKPE